MHCYVVWSIQTLDVVVAAVVVILFFVFFTELCSLYSVANTLEITII